MQTTEPHVNLGSIHLTARDNAPRHTRNVYHDGERISLMGHSAATYLLRSLLHLRFHHWHSFLRVFCLRKRAPHEYTTSAFAAHIVDRLTGRQCTILPNGQTGATQTQRPMQSRVPR